jgi:hypothetical protein
MPIQTEKLPCGHEFTLPSDEVIADLKTFMGIDAKYEIAMVSEQERQKHLLGFCGRPAESLDPAEVDKLRAAVEGALSVRK